MRGRTILSVASAVIVAAVLWPTSAEAQGRGRVRGTRVVVARPVYVRSGFYAARLGNPWYRYGAWGPGWGGWYGPSWGSYWGPPMYRGLSFGSVRIQVEPRHAEVFVDGYFAGHVDDFDGAFQRLDLGPGEHEIQVFLDGYRSTRERLYVIPGRSYKIKSSLARLGSGEPVEPRPEPSQAAPAGQQPRGDAGGPPLDEPPMRSDFTRPRPSRGEARAFGRLAVGVQPDDAQVFIDGEGWRTTPDNDRLVVNVPAGAHRIEVRKAGYATYTAMVDVAPGDTATVNVSLTRDGVEQGR